MWHPKFLNAKGCTAYLRADKNIREVSLMALKNLKRSIISVLVPKESSAASYQCVCKRPSIKRLKAITNYCTIAHITVLLVALTAVKTGNKDKSALLKPFFQIFNFVKPYLIIHRLFFFLSNSEKINHNSR